MKFIGKWNELENIILSEVTQSQKNTLGMHSLKWILAQKLELPKMQSIDHRKLKKDVEHFFRCFSAIWHSSAVNSLFSSEPHFSIGLFGSLESNFLSSLYILDIIPLSDVGL